MHLSRVVKKLLSLAVALFLISVVSFLLTKLTSTNPAENYLRVSKIAITPEALQHATVYLGLDKPLTEQYMDWAQKAVMGDFGMSYVHKKPVLPMVLYGFSSTLTLGGLSFL